MEKSVNNKYVVARGRLRQFREWRLCPALDYLDVKPDSTEDKDLCGAIKQELVKLFDIGIHMAEFESKHNGADFVDISIYIVQYRVRLRKCERLSNYVIPLERQLSHRMFRLRLPGEPGSPEREGRYDWAGASQSMIEYR